MPFWRRNRNEPPTPEVDEPVDPGAGRPRLGARSRRLRRPRRRHPGRAAPDDGPAPAVRVRARAGGVGHDHRHPATGPTRAGRRGPRRGPGPRRDPGDARGDRGGPRRRSRTHPRQLHDPSPWLPRHRDRRGAVLGRGRGDAHRRRRRRGAGDRPRRACPPPVRPGRPGGGDPDRADDAARAARPRLEPALRGAPAARRSSSSSASTAPARPRPSASSRAATSPRVARSSWPPPTRSVPPRSTSSGSGPTGPRCR